MPLKFKLGQLKAVIFDFDGTLANSIPMWKNIIDPGLYKKFGIDFEKSYQKFYDDSHGMSIRNRANLFIEMYGLQGKTTPDEILNLYTELYGKYFEEEVKLFDGVIETLEFLKSKGIKSAIATGCDRSFLDIALGKLNISPYMSAVVTCDEIGENKPHPLVYHAAMEQCGCAKDQCIVIEDSLVGIQGAKNADSLQHLLILSDEDHVEKKKSFTEYFFTDYRQLLKDLQAAV